MAPPNLESPDSVGDVESRWYKALYEEDCVEVMNLLAAYPGLLKVGWKSDPLVKVKGRRVNFWMEEGEESTWKGRTALHVAARRGCAMLVKQVITLCNEWTNIPTIGFWALPYSQRIRDERANKELKLHQFENEVNEFLENQNQKFRDFQEEDEEHGSMSHKAHPTGVIPDHSDLIQSEEEPRETGAGSSHSQSNEMSYKRSVLVAQLKHVLPKRGVAEGTAEESSRGEVDGMADESPRSRSFARWETKIGKKDNRGKGPLPDAADRVNWYNLEDLKDGEYELDAVAMAYLHGNPDVLSLLLPLWLEDPPSASRAVKQKQSAEFRARIRSVTEGLVRRLLENPVSRKSYGSIFQAYSKHRDFNFLPWEEYLFHFLFSTCFRAEKDDASVLKAELLREYLWLEVWWDASSERDSSWERRDCLWSFLLKLQDGQGRTPLHCAVDEDMVQDFMDLLSSDEFLQAHNFVRTARDASGRTAMHKVVAKGDRAALAAISPQRGTYWALWTHVRQSRKDKGVNTDFPDFDFLDMKLDSLNVDHVSVRNGFKGQRLCRGRTFGNTPLLSAIIHRRAEFIEFFVNIKEELIDIPFACGFPGYRYRGSYPCSLNMLEVAALVGDLKTVKEMLQLVTVKLRWQEIGDDEYEQLLQHSLQQCRLPWHGLCSSLGDRWLFQKDGDDEGDGAYKLVPQGNTDVSWQWPIVHFAAYHGDYQMLKAILESTSRSLNPYAEDDDENTALHYAMKMGTVKFEAHLLDYVSCEHLQANDPRKMKKSVLESNYDEDSIIQRQGCINLLLQLGCDVFKANFDGEIPYPSGDLSTNAKFLSWWYGIQSKEFAEVRNTLSFAANAVAVTATLVATASYVGPLQPPLGYDQQNQIQTNYISVRAFTICDTLSFYFAITSITFSLIPSLPMPQQPMVQELRRTRVMVTLATGILFPSIICILVAFASSSIAVTSSGTDGISSPGGTSTIITSSIGGFSCLLGFTLFFIRLLGFVFPRNTYVRKIYDATSF